MSRELGPFVEQPDFEISKVVLIYLLHVTKSVFYIYFSYAQSCVVPLMDMMHSTIFMHMCEVCEACVK